MKALKILATDMLVKIFANDAEGAGDVVADWARMVSQIVGW